MDLHQQVLNVFEETFGISPAFCFQAPGRVNLIGEHTDYNDGFVLPCAIDYQTVIAASPRKDNKVVAVAANYQNQKVEFELALPVPKSKQAFWSNYVQGVAQVLMERGHALQGVNMVIAGNVPQGAGLSSSASLEVVTGMALTTISEEKISPATLALIGQQAENQYVGCNCGIMDQLISACGEKGHALLLDCRSLATQSVSIPKGSAVVIVNSNVKRGLVGSEYNTRRQQCEMAAQYYGVKALRDLTIEQLESGRKGIDSVAWRRARHVVTENTRTELAADALAKGDLKRMGQLMAESHQSMKEDFEITVPAIDGLVDIINGVIGNRGGVRMTGGGFGGCVVALVPETEVEAIRAAVIRDYPSISGGLVADIYVCQASAGAGQVC